MQRLEKHPLTDLPAVVDFSKRLAAGETIQGIVEQPAIVGAADDVILSAALINGSDELLPNGEPIVPAGHGVKFTITGGLDGQQYLIRLKVQIDARNQPAIDLRLFVSTKF